MNNIFKRDIIVSFLIVLIIGSGFVFYLFKNRDSLKQSTSDNNERTIEARRAEFLEEIKNKEKKIHESTKPVEKEVSFETCSSLAEGEVKTACFEYFNFNQYINNGEVTNCDSLNTLGDICIYEVVVRKQEFNYCLNIRQSNVRDLCFSAAALATRNGDYCDKVFSEEKKQECRDILLSSRISLNNISQCALVIKPQYFANCVRNSKQDCSFLGDENLINNCEAWRLFQEIIDNDDSRYCDILPVDNFVKVCKSYFIDKKYLDSDGDAVNDREELNLGTDPFTFNDNLREGLNILNYNNDIIGITLREVKKRIAELL